MKVVEIAFTGYPVTDILRAQKFYEATLGLAPARKFEDGSFCWIEYDIGPTTLAIAKGIPDWTPSSGGGSTAFEVDDFAAAVSAIKARGYTFLKQPFDTPACSMAVVADPDGNAVTIHKRKQ
jgi:predicted enzyme related to lactoylglutathione lyase